MESHIKANRPKDKTKVFKWLHANSRHMSGENRPQPDGGTTYNRICRKKKTACRKPQTSFAQRRKEGQFVCTFRCCKKRKSRATSQKKRKRGENNWQKCWLPLAKKRKKNIKKPPSAFGKRVCVPIGCESYRAIRWIGFCKAMWTAKKIVNEFSLICLRVWGCCYTILLASHRPWYVSQLSLVKTGT